MIIGIHGKLKSGKTTLTNFLTAWGFEELLFADGLKDMVCALLGCTREQLEDQEFKNTEVPWIPGVTPRKLMQTLGTEWGRNINEDLWVSRTLAQARTIPRVIISDVRFPNELQALQGIGALTVKIVRNIDRSGVEHAHISETALDDVPNSMYDIVIDNNGSLAELKQAAGELITNYEKIKEWSGTNNQ